MKKLIIFIFASAVCVLASCSFGTANSSSSTPTPSPTPVPASTNADLSALNTSLPGTGALNPAFSPSIVSYKLNVPNSITSLTLTGTAADSKAKLAGTTSLTNLLVDTPQIGTIIVTAEDGKTVKTYTVEVKRLAANISTNAYLSGFSDILNQQSLNLNSTLSPVFSPTTFAYTLNIPNSITAITISATPQENTATGTNQVKVEFLEVGVPKTATFTITAQDGQTSRTYTIAVTRAAATSLADLADIQVSKGSLSPVFNKQTSSYTVSVDYSVTSVVVTGVKANADSTVTAPVTLSNLAVGVAQTASITVTNKAGTSNYYTVKVTRAADTSTPVITQNADLSALAVSSGTLSPDFSKTNLNYTVSVANSVTSVVVTGTKADANSTVTGPITLSNLVAGVPQTATITVTSQNGMTSNSYNVKVTRADAAAPSTNADLSDLTVSSGTLTPAFNKDTLSYTVSVANSIDAVVVTGTKADANATITGPITLNLVAGGYSSATFYVTAQNTAITKSYTVKVTRDALTLTTLPAAADGTWSFEGNLIFTISSGQLTYIAGIIVTVQSDSSGNMYTSGGVTTPSAMTGYSWDGSVIKFNGTAMTKGAPSPSTTYTTLPASADGTWSYSGLTVFTISGGQSSYSGLTGTYTLQSDTAGNLYLLDGTTRTPLPTYTWDGSVIRSSGTALTKGTPSPSTTYTTLPAAADGTWSYSSITVFTISGGQTSYAGVTGMSTIQSDTDGNLYLLSGTTRTPLPTYTWDGSVIKVSGNPLTKGTPSPSTTYTTLPVAADGTWSTSGITVFTISNGQTSYAGVTGTCTIQSDTAGNLYLLAGTTRTPLPTYTWDGSVIKVSGNPLTKGTPSPSTTYTKLPAAANGTWSYYSPVFTISNGMMTYAGQTSSYLLEYDSSGKMYMTASGTRILMTGYIWTGSVITMSGNAMTKS